MMQESNQRLIVIAHRGASGYLPEHTLEAKALAYAMGADFLEQDCVLTADDVPVVLHDVHLDTVTNVASVYPGRHRDDGRFYAIDFMLAEIKTLRVTERINLKTGRQVFPGRFPAGQGRFEVPTLAEEIEMIQGLNRSSGKRIGIYPEIKQPAWHRAQGKDISRIVVNALHDYGYRSREDACFVQCFDPIEARRIREDLGCQLRIVQLIGENSWKEAASDYDAMRTSEGLRRVAEYAEGIGPALPQVISGVTVDRAAIVTPLVAAAHEQGLVVHPYTLRADDLPKWCNDFDSLLRMCYVDANVDGLFTDFPDRAARVRDAVVGER
ncbi:MAG: glycerophosphodiester phosphodiesterase [Planctomycetaceae bacterium]|nr:glycerophosphodiester phosphodiesterase [Planctomycetaceae bacterium]